MTSTRIVTAAAYLMFLGAALSRLNAASQDAGPPRLASAYKGRVIASVRFEPVFDYLSPADLSRTLTLRQGEVFTEQNLRHSIQNLFATGRFTDIAVDVEPGRLGLVIRLLVKPASFVGRVQIKGVKQPPNSGQLSSAANLDLGLPYSDSAQQDSVRALQNLLRRNGLYRARVNAELDRDPKTQGSNISFSVNAGKRAHIAPPAISGDSLESDAAAIIRATRWKRLFGWGGWQELTEARVRQGVTNVEKAFEKTGHIEAQVTLKHLDYSEASNTVKPVLEIRRGPRVSIEVEGAKIRHSNLTELVPAFQEHTVNPDLLDEGRRNIQASFQSAGYYHASVTYRLSGSSGEGQLVTYMVHKGRRHKFVSVEVFGNHYFPQELIRERLYIQTAELPRFPYGRFSQAFLQADLETVRNLYVSNGFRDVRITSKTLDNYRGRRDQLAAAIEILEGSQWRVADLVLEGCELADLAELRRNSTETSGQPFSVASVAEDRDKLLNYYYARGYVNASFQFERFSNERQHTVSLKYLLNPGRQTYVRDVLVTGLETTRPNLVSDRLGLKKGQPLSLTEQTDSQRRLYNLGIFARVNTALQNPDGDDQDKYVLYDIDEARHYSLNVGVGAQIARIGGGVTTLDNPAGTTGFSPRLALGLSRINFLGLGQTIGVQTAVSTIEQKAAFTYFIPQFVSRENLSLTGTGLIENSNDIRTYTAHRREAAIQLSEILSRAYTVQYRLVFRNVTLSNLKIDQLLVPLLAQPETLGLADVSLIQDKRDDPADAHRGIYSTADISYAPGFLGSRTSFVRGLFRNSTYRPFHRDLVLARSTQFGFISRTGGAADVPLAERIYSGGSTSLRSFSDFQAGPRDLQTGFPLGGNALLSNSFELRFPLYGDNVGGVLFEDAGNVYTSLGDLSFRFRQRNLQDFNYMVQSAGFGIRYRTPIGPIRMDFSFSPDAPRFFGLKGTLQDLINGTAVSSVQKINAFQFHISLGQAF